MSENTEVYLIVGVIALVKLIKDEINKNNKS